eukprot:Skav221967  [mRNA]  locus=scaffold195:861654:868407:- [translate_table: standard]
MRPPGTSPEVHKTLRPREWQTQEDATAEDEARGGLLDPSGRTHAVSVDPSGSWGCSAGRVALVRRVLDASPDVFATLGLSPEDRAAGDVGMDSVDGKAARSSYKKLALKVHPDKAPEELKAQQPGREQHAAAVRAKEAFDKVEKAAAAVEAGCLLRDRCGGHSVPPSSVAWGSLAPLATAVSVLAAPDDVTPEEAGKKGRVGDPRGRG